MAGSAARRQGGCPSGHAGALCRRLRGDVRHQGGVRAGRARRASNPPRVDLTEGKEGFDFLGCHLHKRMSRLWEQYGRRRYDLQRWPSQRSMRRLRQRVKELVGPRHSGVRDVRVLIRALHPVLRGWGNYFRTGNAARKFNQMDTYVSCRLRRFLVRPKGRNLHAGEAAAWTRDFFWSHGLHRLR